MTRQPWVRRSSFGRCLIWATILHVAALQCLPGFLCIAAAEEAARAAASAKEAPPLERDPLPDGALTLGGRLGDGVAEGMGDVLVPLWYSSAYGLLFLNPRTSFNDNDEEEVNLGLGFRSYCPNVDAIFGANLYYDSRCTEFDNQFDQLGLGLEYLSEWVDARANYYLPDDQEELADTFTEEETSTSVSKSRSAKTSVSDVYPEVNQFKQDIRTTVKEKTTTTRTTTRFVFEQYESALEGWDAELGVKVPALSDLVETRVFLGYQSFDNPYGEDLEGLTARLESWVLPGVAVDAQWFEEEALNGTEYYVGARVRVPFDLARLGKRRNPFAGAESKSGTTGAGRAAIERLTDPVIRDVKVQTAGEVRENEAKRTSTKTSSSTTRTVSSSKDEIVILDDVTFVNNGNAAGSENGTFENPWNRVQEGVDNAFGERNVYVLGGHGPYPENVVLSSGIRLIGQGTRIEGLHGKSFGGDQAPVINGRSLGPAITMADQTSVGGFTVINPDWGGPLQPVTVGGMTMDISRIGIFSRNATDLTVYDNLLVGNEGGAVLVENLVDHFVVNASGNTALFNEGYGLGVLSIGQSGTTDVTIADSTFSDNPGYGLAMLVQSTEVVNITLDGLVATGNGDQGIRVMTTSNQFVTLTASDLFLAGNDQGGMLMEARGDFQDAVFLSGVRAVANGIYGAGLDLRGVHPLAMVADSQFLGNFGDGLALNLIATGSTAVAALDGGVVAQGNLDDGIVGRVEGDVAVFQARGMNASGNGDDGLELLLEGVYSAQNLLAASTADNNQGHGIALTAISSTGTVSSMFDDLFAEGNGVDGLFAVLDAYGPVNSIMNLVDANGNLGGDGISLYAASAESLAQSIVYNCGASGNDGNGMALLLLSPFQINSIVARIDADLNQGGDGIDLTAVAASGIVQSVVYDFGANGNVGDGLNAMLDGRYGVDTRIALADVNYNLAGNGIDLLATSASGSVRSVITDVFADHNVGAGIQALLDARDAALSEIRMVDAKSNGSDGINLFAGSSQGAVSSLIDDVEAVGNGTRGLAVLLDGRYGVQSLLQAITASENRGGAGIDLLAASSSGVVNSVVFDVWAAGNSGHGLNVLLDGRYGVTSGFREVEASDNAGDGINVLAASSSGSVDSVFFDVGADANGGRGMGILLDGRYGVNSQIATVDANANEGGHGIDLTAVSSDAGVQSSIADVLADANAGQGINVLLDGRFGVQSRVDYVEASYNQGSAGLFLLASSPSGVVDSVIYDVFANHNNGDGINVLLDARYGVSSDIELVDANRNSMNGLRLMAVSSSGGVESSVLDVGANRNGANGLSVLLDGRYGIDSMIATVDADLNQGGYGLQLTAVSSSGGVRSVVGDVGANANLAGGMNILLDGWFGVESTIREVDADLNQGVAGLVLLASSSSGAVQSVIRDVFAENNAMNGLMATLDGRFGVSSEMTWVDANGNGAQGIELMAMSSAGGVESQIDEVGASGNGNGGLRALFDGRFGVQSVVQSMDADLNRGGAGLALQAFSASGGVSSTIFDVGANGNATGGMSVALNGRMGAQSSIVFVDANRNLGPGGLLLEVGSASGGVSSVISDAVAENNAGSGISASLDGLLGVASTFDLVYAGGNSLDGVDLVAQSASGGVSSAISGAFADANGQVGVVATLVGHLGTSSSIDGLSASDNRNGAGLVLTLVSSVGGAGSTASNMTLNNNAGGGAIVTQVGTAGVFSEMANVTANDNQGVGILFTGVGSPASAGVRFEDVTANNNQSDGLLAVVVGDSVDVSLFGVAANGNGANGARVIGSATSALSMGVDESTASGNGGCGLLVEGSGNLDVDVVVAHSSALANSSNGIDVVMTSPLGSARVGFSTNTVSLNGQDGIHAWVSALSGTATVEGYRNTSIFNLGDGIEVHATGAVVDVDFGDASSPLGGLHSIYGNQAFDFNNSGQGTALAQQNWWGTPAPLPGQFNGSVDVSFPLAADPNP